jgi:hypothetical protein
MYYNKEKIYIHKTEVLQRYILCEISETGLYHCVVFGTGTNVSDDPAMDFGLPNPEQGDTAII